MGYTGLSLGVIGLLVTFTVSHGEDALFDKALGAGTDRHYSNILGNLTGIPDIAALPPAAGVILVGISMLLTLIAGIIPSRIASRKDPVVALRSE